MIIFEPPAALSGAPQIWIGASGGNGTTADPSWGGCNVWLSLDGSTFEQVGQITSPAREGVLTAALGAYAGTNFDTADTLSVNLAKSAGTLFSTAAANASAGGTLCLVDGELLAFTTATLTGVYQYALTGLYRGLYGTTPTAHASGVRFGRLDGSVFIYPLPPVFVGKTIYLKLQSFNVFGGGVQSLAACMAFAFTPAGVGFLGPILLPLSAKQSLNLGRITEGVTLRENLGLITDPVTGTVSLGTVP